MVQNIYTIKLVVSCYDRHPDWTFKKIAQCVLVRADKVEWIIKTYRKAV